MTVAELRALLETLPERFDDTEVMVYNGHALAHVLCVELDRRRWSPRRMAWGEDLPEDRRQRKLRIDGGNLYTGTPWYKAPPDWSLKGWWPQEAADIGLPEAP